MNVPQLSLNYNVPDILEKIVVREDDVRALAAYYSVTFTDLKAYRQKVWKSRLGFYLAGAKAPYDITTIEELTGGERIPATDGEQLVTNLNTVMLWLESRRGTRVDIPLLQEMHTMLSARLCTQHNAGKLRPQQSTDLFSRMQASNDLPNDDALQQYLPQMIQLANDRAIPALIRSWLFYYVFITLQPFATHNDTMAILAAEHVLRQQDDDFHGLINLEKHLFLTDGFQVTLAELMKDGNYRQKLEEELTPLLSECLKGYEKALLEVNEILSDHIKNDLSYDALTPRQKNSINFFLETFFNRHRHKIDKLTERQREMLEMMLKNGCMQNKDFIPIYHVDRKTIQRDFNTLLEQRLVTTKGAGRSLSYCVDMKVMLDN